MSAVENDGGFEAPVHRALVRPMLLMGGERELVMMSGLIAGIFIVSFLKVWSITFGVVLWLVSVYFLRRMAEKDPVMSKVFIRSIRYPKYLLPQSTPFAPEIEHK
jgi:type IV secretion system protein VirB3